MATTMAISGGVILKAGANATTALTEAQYTAIINQAEDYINLATTHNWCDDYATLSDDIKFALQDATECLAAMMMIMYDMSGFASRLEAQTMLDVLYNRAQAIIKELKEKDTQTFVGKVA